MEFFHSLIRSVVKTVIHFVTGKSELQRLTQEYPSGRLYIVREVRRSLKLSKKLRDIKLKVVEQCEDFSLSTVIRVVRDVKGFENPGLVFALSSLRRTNIGIAHLHTLARTDFSKENESGLNELWDCLKPQQKRQGSDLRSSTSWSDIGFQGLDPATDFRGAGVLSLENLRYFARENPETARQILEDQCRDITQGGFPFALAGINLTAFLLGLAKKRVLDDLFLFVSSEAEEVSVRQQQRRTGGHVLQSDESSPLLADNDHAGYDDDNGHIDDDQTKSLALERFNGAYTVIFTMFANRWRQAAPRDAMEFPNVYGPFKQEIERLIQTPRGIATLARV